MGALREIRLDRSQNGKTDLHRKLPRHATVHVLRYTKREMVALFSPPKITPFAVDQLTPAAML